MLTESAALRKQAVYSTSFTLMRRWLQLEWF